MAKGLTYNYVKIPVSLIPTLYKGRKGVMDVILYCIYETSKTFDFDSNNVARRLVYEFCNTDIRKRMTDIPEELKQMMYKLDKEASFLEDDYRGFTHDGTSYDPLDENKESVIDRVEKELADNNELWETATDYYQIDQAAKLHNIRIHNIGNVIDVRQKYKDCDNCRAFAYAKLSKLVELADKKALQPEDIEIYAGNLAFKSIIGKAKVGRTETKLVLARMVGCVSADDVTDDYLEYNPIAARIFKKYSDKGNFRRLAGRLRDGYLKFIETVPGKSRLGTFFSFTRDLSKKDFEQAILDIVREDKKKAERMKKRIQRKRKAMGCRKPIEIRVEITKRKVGKSKNI